MKIFPAAAATVAVALSLILLSCDHGSKDPKDVGGRYDYVAWNAGDTIVVSGSISIVKNDSANLTGTWRLTAIGPAGGIGPQTGAGSLTGELRDSVTIDLNPAHDDNNVILYGKPHIDEISGRWEWTTIGGVSGTGRFRMTKR
jgi:hypothetical protein